jgi:hypothetical protein
MGLRQYTARRSLDLSSVRSISELERRRAERERIGPAFAVVAPREPERNDGLSELQTIALLRMADSTMCRGIAVHLQVDVQDRPQWSDYRALVARGFAVPPEGDERWHRASVMGASEARRIAMIEARRRGIHFLCEGVNYGSQALYRCSCGKWSISRTRGPQAYDRAQRAFVNHMIRAAGDRPA